MMKRGFLHEFISIKVKIPIASTITGAAPAPRIHNGSIGRSDTDMLNSINASGGVPRGQIINFESSREGGGGVDIFEQQDMKYDSTGMFHW